MDVFSILLSLFEIVWLVAAHSSRSSRLTYLCWRFFLPPWPNQNREPINVRKSFNLGLASHLGKLPTEKLEIMDLDRRTHLEIDSQTLTPCIDLIVTSPSIAIRRKLNLRRRLLLFQTIIGWMKIITASRKCFAKVVRSPLLRGMQSGSKATGVDIVPAPRVY